MEAGDQFSSVDADISWEQRSGKRVYKDISRCGETPEHSWGTCCECEAQGEIMTWPKRVYPVRPQLVPDLSAWEDQTSRRRKACQPRSE